VPIINISCYKFIGLDDLSALKLHLTSQCLALHLTGTILLAPEGINIFLAGGRAQIDDFIASMRGDARFHDLQPKESISAMSPFKRLRVRLKKEIITMKLPLLRPEAARAPAVTATTLKHWLDRGYDDAGRTIVMLDTRNDYEVAAGTFQGAVDFNIARFSDFSARLQLHRAVFRDKTIVSFCTGGIRCEKAALHMQGLGIENVYQLEGGILKYFEEVGRTHYEGSCFVFDSRGTLDPDLQPTCIPASP
jgi:UPF0176 protein